MLFIYRLVAALLICMFIGKASAAQQNQLPGSIKNIADSIYRESLIPGLMIMAIKNEQVYFYDTGYAHPDVKRRFDANTVFEAGSITKTFTAYIVKAVLEEKGIPDTSAILPYLPDSVQNNTSLSGITFLSLLNHTSGFPRLPTNMSLEGGNMMKPYDDYDSGKLFSYLLIANPKPNGKSNYSNLGMGLAGVLAELISGKPYEQLLNEYILVPFGMLTKNPGKDMEPLKSQGYFGEQKSAYWNMNTLAPAGGLKCTGSEMMAYLKYMMAPKDALINNRINKLLQPTIALNNNIDVCRGWHTYKRKDKAPIYWHNGGTYGFSTFAAFNRESASAVLVVINKSAVNTQADFLGLKIMKLLSE